MDPELRIPFLTSAIDGTGGTIKASPDDFEVEELPAYQPSGEGDHLYLWIEKRGVAAEQLIRHVAQVLELAPGEVGCAGMKDRHAVTRQFLSVPRRVQSAVPAINTVEICVLETCPHAHKLRTGHLAGNRFRVIVRDVVPDAEARATQTCEILRRTGMANFFGAQRFGRDKETAVLGMRLLRGEIRSVACAGNREKFLRKLALSAAQAVLFNRYLARRIEDGLLHTVLDGDVMQKRTGGMFYVTDTLVEQARFDCRETVPAGPIYGKKMFAARGQAAGREAEVLAELGIPPSQLRGFGRLLSGTRRRNIVFVDGLEITRVPGGLQFQFSLPAGSYATVLLGEFIK